LYRNLSLAGRHLEKSKTKPQTGRVIATFWGFFIKTMKYYKNLSLEDLFYINEYGLICCEKWKCVIGYEDRYIVSDLGRIKTLNYNKTKKQGILKQQLSNSGYLTITLHGNGAAKNTRTVHLIVAKAFVKRTKNKPIVNHKAKNGDKTNNCAINLEWSTYSENGQHAYDNKLSIAAKGESYKSKLTEQKVIEIRNIKDSFLQKDLAKKYDVSRVTISDILRRKSWKHI